MTREEINLIIDYHKRMQESYIEGEGYERHPLPEWYALDKAIEFLEQQSCEDAISRQAVLDGVDRYIYKSQSTGTQDDFYSFAELVVKQLPSVTPQPKTGRWIDGKCNRCGTHAPFWAMASTYYLSEYCPHCGAKMTESEDE